MLRNAVNKGHEDIVRYLISKEADVKAWNNDPIRTAAENGHLGIVKLLVEAGAELNSGYYGGDTLGPRGQLRQRAAGRIPDRTRAPTSRPTNTAPS